MPRQQSSPETLDLFGLVPSADDQAEPIRLPATRPTSKLASLSDAELSTRLTDVVREVHRRIPDAPVRKARPELDRAIHEAAAILARLAPRMPEQPERLTAAGETSAIFETKRNAIRAALLAGVKPGQVAKHFGVPLAAVRQIATKTA